jgi:peptidyl-prolyl cis-trans isomerase SurA
MMKGILFMNKKYYLYFFLLLSFFAYADVKVLNKIVAVVDDSVILESELVSRLSDVKFQFAQRKTDSPPEDILRKQVLEQMILESLQINLANRAGIRIDDAELNAALTDIAKQNKMDLAAFQKKVDESDSGGYQELRKQVRNDLVMHKLRQRKMQERIRITDQDVNTFLSSPIGKEALANEYRISHIFVALPAEPTPKDIAAAEAKIQAAEAALKSGQAFAKVAATYSNAETALKGGDLGWRKAGQLPSLYEPIVEKLKVGEVSSAIKNNSGFHLVMLQEKNSSENVKIPQWQVQHILIKATELLSSEDAKQKLNEIRDRAVKGEKFSDLARLYSDDPGSGRQGGSLNWVNEGDMVPEFDQKMRAIELNKISEVFQTPFGWHILQVTGKRDHDVSDLYRQNMARQALFARQVDEEFNQWLRELRNEAFVEIRS